jgi:hypothetical protein
MRFDYERQMINPAEQWLRSQGLSTKKEFTTPWGVCDLVGCSFRKEGIERRRKLGQTKPIGPQLRVMIWTSIPDLRDGRSITLRKLQRTFEPFFDGARIGNEVDRLVRDKFVQRTTRGTFQRVDGWVPLHRRLVALELKLTRINEALFQAASNLGFADESYVGLPGETALRVIQNGKREEFIRLGVGVVGVGPRTCKVLLEAGRGRCVPDETLRIHAVERFWRTRIKDSSA